MKNIVLIDHEPYSTRRRDIFMVEEYIKLGYKYEVWCLASYIFKDNYKVTDTITTNYLKNINSLNQLESLIKKVDINNTVFIIECYNGWSNRKIFKLLSDYNCYTIKIDFYANNVLKKDIKTRLRQLLSYRFGAYINNLFKSILFSIYKKRHNIKEFRRILSSSNIVKRTDKINHPDYERIHFGENVAVLKYDYIVFCDVFFPFHPDLAYFTKLKSLPDGKDYQITLTKFFDYLEQVYRIPVIIAAHPKATYNGDEFGNRKIIRNQTVNLVKNSKMVVLHNSNSISYSILTNKPVAFISTKDYENVTFLKHSLHLLATTLNHSVYNLDILPFNKIDFLPIKNDIREEYIYTYLTSPETENKKNRDIIRDIIDSLIIN